MTQTNTSEANPATYGHRTVTQKAFRKHIDRFFGFNREPAESLNGYKFIEYMNSPAGLIVLAHQDTADGHVDGIHPTAISKHVQSFRNIISPLVDEASGYATHYIRRRSQGALVAGAFGRMIYPDDPEVTSFERDRGHFRIELFNGTNGPIVAVFEDANRVHVIERGVTTAAGEAA